MSLSKKSRFERIKKFIRWGSTGSEAMLDFPFHTFQIEGCAGMIAYRLESNCAIIFGDPVCSPEEMPKLTEAFHRYCKEKNLHVLYFIVLEHFAWWAHPHLCSILMEVCEELIFDPQVIPTIESKRLKKRIHDAQKHGLTFKEYLSEDKNIEQAIQEVGIKWHKKHQGPQIYLGHLDFFENRLGKRWFYIEDKQEIIAMALLTQLEAKEGWLLKFLMAVPEAYYSTSEFLMTSILEVLWKEGCRFLTYGMVPAKSLGIIQGLNPFSAWLSRIVFAVTKWMFKLDQRKAYWLRYHPKSEPAYLLFSNPCIGLNEIKALIKAFKTEFKH